MKPDFSLVIPCYNEADNLNGLFEKVIQLTTGYPNAEIVLVNNGSKDQTHQLLENFANSFPNLIITICNVPENKGYGYGILEGLKIAQSNVLSWTHADLQTDLMDAGIAFEMFSENPDKQNLLVKGFRTNRNKLETLFSFGMAIYASIVLRTWLMEINAQPKMFNRKFYETIFENAPLDFSLDLYWMFKAKKNWKNKDISGTIYSTCGW